MAKIISPVWSSIRGSIAGTTYLTTAAGQIIARQRTRPVNTPTDFRGYIRAAMAYMVVKWANLTVAQRTAWATWAAAMGLATGRQAFLSGEVFAQFLINSGLPASAPLEYLTAPEMTYRPAITLSARDLTTTPGDGIDVVITNTGLLKTMYYVEISPGLPASRNYWKGPYDTSLAYSVEVTSASGDTKHITGLSLGQKYFVRARGVSTDTTAGKHGRVLCSAVYATRIATHLGA